jgi:hypothetical protein
MFYLCSFCYSNLFAVSLDKDRFWFQKIMHPLDFNGSINKTVYRTAFQLTIGKSEEQLPSGFSE